ncbi:DUF1839 family protein [Neorhizobium sp. NPDC001467]|uniref:DUF1839 family protein n=1 Tax=Neorhizobium sp. NPDC001467 TaxID=3390595 RepID=UPI003CFDD879
MTAVFPQIDPAAYVPHALHATDRIWPETNCYVDLWIEVLAAAGLPPEAMLGFTLTQDFEGDQMTFFKVPLEDLETLYGIRVTELAIFDRPEIHVLEQISRKRLCLLEMDSFYLPDTRGLTYRTEHGKTTVAINRLDMAGQHMDYFHNGGLFSLSGADFAGIFQQHLKDGDVPLLPYTEFAKFPAKPVDRRHIRTQAERLLRRHFARRPDTNPVRAFASVFALQATRLAERDFAFFHKYAFNTLRQMGANFELLASHLTWLDRSGQADRALTIAETAKSAQFLLARALARKRFDPLTTALDPAAEAWDLLMAGLSAELGDARAAA